MRFLKNIFKAIKVGISFYRSLKYRNDFKDVVTHSEVFDSLDRSKSYSEIIPEGKAIAVGSKEYYKVLDSIK